MAAAPASMCMLVAATSVVVVVMVMVVSGVMRTVMVMVMVMAVVMVAVMVMVAVVATAMVSLGVLLPIQSRVVQRPPRPRLLPMTAAVRHPAPAAVQQHFADAGLDHGRRQRGALRRWTEAARRMSDGW